MADAFGRITLINSIAFIVLLENSLIIQAAIVAITWFIAGAVCIYWERQKGG